MSRFLWSPSQIFFIFLIFFLCSTSRILGKFEVLWLQSGFFKTAKCFQCYKEVGSKFVALNLKNIFRTEEERCDEQRLGRSGVLYIFKMFKSSLELTLFTAIHLQWFLNSHQTALKEQQRYYNAHSRAHSLLILEHF